MSDILNGVFGTNQGNSPSTDNPELAASAKTMFVMRNALVEAGFTKSEANKMVISFVLGQTT